MNLFQLAGRRSRLTQQATAGRGWRSGGTKAVKHQLRLVGPTGSQGKGQSWQSLSLFLFSASVLEFPIYLTIVRGFKKRPLCFLLLNRRSAYCQKSASCAMAIVMLIATLNSSPNLIQLTFVLPPVALPQHPLGLKRPFQIYQWLSIMFGIPNQ